ncbi:fukutin [Loa loa]|nr:fukutin [Loa loa]EFO13858.1 fukutin [Loa loa]
MNSSFIKLSLRFNRPEDLLEYKVYIEDSIPMDIFFLYHDQNSSWIGGLSYMTKYRFIYPLINRICATDLLGYLMYVPCNALDVIMSEYGKRWSEPLHSSKYVWNETPLNKKVVGTVPPEQRAESFIKYDR